MSVEASNKLLEAFKKGQVQGLLEPGIVPTHIRTQISDVFLFPSSVYKIYRRDNLEFNQFFVDLADPDIRRDFFQKDFQWNHHFSSSVYQRLLGVQMHGDQVELIPETDLVFDRVIEMRKIDTSANLTDQLLQGTVSEKDACAIGFEITKAIESFPEVEPVKGSMLQNLEILMRDVEVWSWMADPMFPRALTDAALNALRGYIQEHKDVFSALPKEEFVIGMDNHSDNVFYENGKMFLIDVYPPKADWRTIERSYSVYRLATAMEVLGDASLAEAFIQGCTDYYGKDRPLRAESRWFYQLYSALIMAPYFYLLGQKDPSRLKEAQLYRAFIERSING